MRYFFLLIFFIFSCNSSNQTDITEQEVKDKFDEFFGVLSVDNPCLLYTSDAADE